MWDKVGDSFMEEKVLEPSKMATVWSNGGRTGSLQECHDDQVLGEQ